MSTKKFIQIVWEYYRTHKRDLPWRNTKNPYRIWVSEIMLQQTQVDRVIPKYKNFLKMFPTLPELAQAPLRDVLIAWQGLGYNRRAKLLHAGAQHIQKHHKGVFPKENLTTIPGIGPYTAGAIQAFAFNNAAPIIETNIRTVYTHHFFPNETSVTDAQLLPKIEQTLDVKNPREWYWALMDYGAYLKRSGIRINNKSKHYTKQSAFKGSKREIRGAILAALTDKPKTKHALQALFPERKTEVSTQVDVLYTEGFLEKKGRYYQLAS